MLAVIHLTNQCLHSLIITSRFHRRLLDDIYYYFIKVGSKCALRKQHLFGAVITTAGFKVSLTFTSLMNMSYLSYWRQVEEGMQRDPAQQNHEGQRVPQMVGGGEGRGPLEHTGLRASTHRYQEQHRQRKKDGDAYGT